MKLVSRLLALAGAMALAAHPALAVPQSAVPPLQIGTTLGTAADGSKALYQGGDVSTNTVLPPYPGAVAQTMAAFGGNALSVNMFGVSPRNGTASDQAPFNAARASITSGSGAIDVPAGPFLITSQPCPTGAGGFALWRLNGVTSGTSGNPPNSLGCPTDTVEDFYNGTIWTNRPQSSASTGPVRRITGNITNTDGSGNVGILQIESNYGPVAPAGSVGPAFTNYPWALVAKVNSYASGGSPVAFYCQHYRKTVGGGTEWCAVAEYADQSGAPSSVSGPFEALEIDCGAVGNDDVASPTYGGRMCLDLVANTQNVQGVSALSITAGGTGGTAGTYPLAFSGGTFTRVAVGTYMIDATGAVVSTSITDQGYYTGSTAPAVAFPSGGVSGATATASLGVTAATIGTGIRVGTKPAAGAVPQASMRTVLRVVNNTPILDSIIDATGAALGATASVLKMKANQAIDFSGDYLHTLRYTGQSSVGWCFRANNTTNVVCFSDGGNIVATGTMQLGSSTDQVLLNASASGVATVLAGGSVTDKSLQVSGKGAGFTFLGSATSPTVMQKRSAAPANAPGAGNVALFAVAGTNSGTCKLQVMAGISTTPVTIVDNVGAGC